MRSERRASASAIAQHPEQHVCDRLQPRRWASKGRAKLTRLAAQAQLPNVSLASIVSSKGSAGPLSRKDSDHPAHSGFSAGVR